MQPTLIGNMTSSPVTPQGSSLSNLSRIKIGEELIADAEEWLESVSEEFDDTVLFSGSKAEARLLWPALARTFDEARADLTALERALSAFRGAQNDNE